MAAIAAIAAAGPAQADEYAHTGSFGTHSAAMPPPDGSFGYAVDVDADANGNVVVPDLVADRVSIFNSTGVFLAKFGAPGTGYGQLTCANA